MKKLLIGIMFTFIFLILVACEYSFETTKIENAELTDTIKAKYDTLLIFKLEDGSERVLYWEEESVPMKIGENYNVEYTTDGEEERDLDYDASRFYDVIKEIDIVND